MLATVRHERTTKRLQGPWPGEGTAPENECLRLEGWPICVHLLSSLKVFALMQLPDGCSPNQEDKDKQGAFFSFSLHLKARATWRDEILSILVGKSGHICSVDATLQEPGISPRLRHIYTASSDHQYRSALDSEMTYRFLADPVFFLCS